MLNSLAEEMPHSNKSLEKVQGFSFSGLACGIKNEKSKELDLGLVFSDFPCEWAGVFTENNLKAPCILDNQRARSQKVQALVVNSGNANCCTGKKGEQAIDEIKNSLAKEFLNLKKSEILSASTGILGQRLPVDKIISNIPKLKKTLNSESYRDFAQAILTTDLKTKIVYKNIQGVNFLGIAKGSGMIHPKLATMLAFIFTDARPDKINLTRTLAEATKLSFNQISVDGDTSTNDMVLLLANSASNISLKEELLRKTISTICSELAKKIVADGEGSNKLIEVELKNYKNQSEALKISRGIASSNLVKCAIFGNSPNWGRILSAAGQNGLKDFKNLSLFIQEVLVFRNNQEVYFNQENLSKKIESCKEVKIKLEYPCFATEENSSKAWGCELSKKYVEINAEYLN